MSRPVPSTPALPVVDESAAIGVHAAALAEQLKAISEALFPPQSAKTLRRFTSGEAARWIGVSDSRLRQLALAGEGPQPATGPGGRRLYTLSDINALRRVLSHQAKGQARGGGRIYLPHRAGTEHLQVLAVTNFKGGSGKTTTAAHLAQYLALRGYRVLAVDLDPQASLSALFGLLPEVQVRTNETLYAALRYDEQRRPMRSITRRTYIDGLDLVPANLELMEFEHETPRVLARRGEGDGGPRFYARLAAALDEVQSAYDIVVLDCPPQLGFLTLAALCAATGVVVTVHPQMLDVASMSQFLLMTDDLLQVVREAGGQLQFDFYRYLITRHEPQDGPQAKVVALLRSLFGDHVLTSPMLKSAAVADAGLTKQTLYEVGREALTRQTYDRAAEALDLVNAEIERLVLGAWGRDAAHVGGARAEM